MFPYGNNAHCQFWVVQTEETQHIENKSLNGEFQRYIILYLSSLAGSLSVKPKRYIQSCAISIRQSRMLFFFPIENFKASVQFKLIYFVID